MSEIYYVWVTNSKPEIARFNSIKEMMDHCESLALLVRNGQDILVYDYQHGTVNAYENGKLIHQGDLDTHLYHRQR